MFETSQAYKNHSRIRPIPNQLFNVSTPNGKNGILIQQLNNVPDYRDEIISSWKQNQTPSVTHRTVHDKDRGKRSYEVDIPDIKAEYISIIEPEVIKAGTFYNYAGRKATCHARQILLYEPGEGCIVHADDQDSAEDEYGVGTVIFNWANQLIALLFISTEGIDYEGGALHMPNADFYVHGEHGKLVMMPGHYKYKHGVTPITSGYRMAVQTTWRFDL